MTKYIIGENFSSGGVTLYKNPSDQTVHMQVNENCSNPCIPFVLPKPLKDIPECTKWDGSYSEQQKCALNIAGESLDNFIKSDNYHVSCEKLEFTGAVDRNGTIDTESRPAVYIGWTFKPPEKMLVNEEYLICDTTTMIGSNQNLGLFVMLKKK